MMLTTEAPTGLPHSAMDPDRYVIVRLEEAGETLLSLPLSGYTLGTRCSMPDIVRNYWESYNIELAAPPVMRAPRPAARKITEMDEALSWIALIPSDRYVLRRIAGMRALINPVTQRHVWSWRRLGQRLGADHRAIQRWHAEAIGLIVAALPRRGFIFPA